MPNDLRADKITKDRRIRLMVDWILDGHVRQDIIRTCADKWGIGEKMAAKYIKEARKVIVKITESDIKEQLSWHIAVRMKMFTGMQDKNKPAGVMAGLNVMKDIADLQGFYLQKVDVSSKGNPIMSQDINVTLNLH